MKILNLYAGVGGNRRLWGDKHEITAVEWNKSVADCYTSRHIHTDSGMGYAECEQCYYGEHK